MNKNHHKLTRFTPVLLLMVIWLLLVLANYGLGTWLIGWDTLLPELNFSLNIKRSLLGTWQQYQGLGITGGMAHNADFVRQIFLVIFNLLIPKSFLRYLWTFLMLLLGPLGVYLLAGKFFKDSDSCSNKFLPAGLSALFYLLNLATVQYFFVPYESFVTFFGFLPWILYTFLNFLDQPHPKRLLWFSLVFFLSTPAYYVQTLFVVLIVVISIFSLQDILSQTNQIKANLKRHAKLYLIVLLLSLFWLVPVLYFTTTSVSDTTQSHQNQIATIESQLQNKGFGSLLDIAQLKGYWFQYTDFKTDSRETVYLLSVWRKHFDQPVVQVLAVFLFVFAWFGYTAWILKRKIFGKKQDQSRWVLAAAILFLLSMIMISGGRGVLGLPFQAAVNWIPLFGQIFRTSFTKWSVVAALSQALGLGLALQLIFTKLNDSKLLFKSIAFFAMTAILVYLNLPSFQGHLIDSKLRREIPSEYFQLFSYLNNQPLDKRVLTYPSPSFWGWQFHDWSYRGSGFLWYGIKQPIVDRNFDAWSLTNERAYYQIFHAINNREEDKLKQSLAKYDISYVLLDRNIVAFSTTPKDLQIEQMIEMLSGMGGEIEFQQGSLTLVGLPKLAARSGFVINPVDYTLVDYSQLPDRWDPIYAAYGSYVKQTGQSYAAFPFIGVDQHQITNQSQANRLSVQVGQGGELQIPSFWPGDHYAGLVELAFGRSGINLDFISPGKVELADASQDLPAPTDLLLPVDPDIDSIVIDLSGKPITIKRDESKRVWFPALKVGEEFVINYFDQDKSVTEDRVTKVSRQDLLTYQVTSDFWQPLLTPTTLDWQGKTGQLNLQLKLRYQFIDPARDFETVNCDVFSRGNVNSDFQDGVVYQIADNYASLCQNYLLTDTDTRLDYWLRLSGENTAGRPLKFYLTNSENKQVLLEELTPFGNYSHTYSLIGQDNLEKGWYELNVNTSSMGGEQAVNGLHKIELFQTMVPFDWLSRIKLIHKEESLRVKNSIQLENYQQIGTGLYKVVLNGDHQSSGLLVLQQSHDSGWIAISRKAPFKPLDQVKYNGWANGWQLAGGEELILLIFWPQLTVLLAYFSLGLVLCYLAAKAFLFKKE